MKFRYAIFLLLASILLSACGFSLAEDITPPPDYQSPTPGPTKAPLYPLVPMDLANGESIYAEKCAPCHGDQGLGDGPMAASLQKQPAAIGNPAIASKASLVNWYTTVTEGNINSFMPPFNGSLNDQQRWDVVAYSLSLGGFDLNTLQQGADVYAQYCEECHGTDGKMVSTADFSDQIMMSKLSQNDIANFIVVGVGTMKGFGDTIPQNDLAAVTTYMRSMTLDMGSLPTAYSDVSAPETAAEASQPEADPTPEPTAEGSPASTNIIGDVSGVITNGSEGKPAANAAVVLHGFTHDFNTQQFTEQVTLDGTTDQDGAYVFPDMDLTQYQAFYISVEFEGMVYASDPAFSTGTETELTIPLTIYGTSTDKSGLSAEQSHIILDYSNPDKVQVIEFLIISNNSNNTIIGEDSSPAIINVPLPQGYSNLQFEEGVLGGRYIEIDGGFADTMSVSPGPQSHQIVFAFELPLEKSSIPFFGKPKVQIDQTFEMRAKMITLLVPEGISVNAPGFTTQPSTDMGNGSIYQTFFVQPEQENYLVSFTATGSIAGSAVSENSSQTGIVIGIAALGLVLILLAAFLYIKSRREEEALLAEVDEEEETSDDEILDAIIALDDQFKAGKISEKTYQSRRQDLIDQISGEQE